MLLSALKHCDGHFTLFSDILYNNLSIQAQNIQIHLRQVESVVSCRSNIHHFKIPVFKKKHIK